MTERGAIATARAIAAGEYTAVEACDAAIARIEDRDGPINAVVIRDFDRARAAAAEADAAVARGERRPLLGVPMTVKESFDIGGLKTSWGFAEHANHIATTDSYVVARLKAAGAVILGKSNVPVALADWQSFNPNYGRTNNPHDLSRSPGGSSGGAAAALAAEMVPLEYGSDIGGSIRVPAHFCGVAGLKTTFGVVPLEGHNFPGTDQARFALSVVGPMAREIEDVALALDLTTAHPLPTSRIETLTGLRILLLTRHPLAPADPQVIAAVEAAARAAEGAGAIVETETDLLPDLARLHTDYWKMLRVTLARGLPQEGMEPVSLNSWFEMNDVQARHQRQLARLFQRYDAIFSPVIGVTAFPHTEEADFEKRSLTLDGQPAAFAPQFAWISIATYGSLPALALPIGKDRDGLPIGLQIVTREYADHDALRIGALVQEAMT